MKSNFIILLTRITTLTSGNTSWRNGKDFHNPWQNILEQINRYMSGTLPHPYKQYCQYVQRDCSIIRGGRRRTFDSSTAFSYTTKLVPNIYARIVFGFCLKNKQYTVTCSYLQKIWALMQQKKANSLKNFATTNLYFQIYP